MPESDELSYQQKVYLKRRVQRGLLWRTLAHAASAGITQYLGLVWLAEEGPFALLGVLFSIIAGIHYYQAFHFALQGYRIYGIPIERMEVREES